MWSGNRKPGGYIVLSLSLSLSLYRVCSFSGFRDMPFSGGMARKLSTCSLPAALLMEQTLTPSSSYDRFSPTGSTCSLDKYSHTPAGGGRDRTLTSAHVYHRSTQEVRPVTRHLSNSEPPPTSSSAVLVNGTLSGEGSGARIIDTVITIPSSSSGSKSSTNPSSRVLDGHRTSDPPTALRTNASAMNNSAAIPSGGLASNRPGGISPASTSQAARSKYGGDGGSSSPGLHNSSWADTAEGDSVKRPDWAQLPNSNGGPHSGTVPWNGNKMQYHAGIGIRSHVGVAPFHADSVGVQYQVQQHYQHHVYPSSQPSGSTSIHGYHAHHPSGKRNSHESGGSGHSNAVTANPSDIIIPQPLHHAMARNQVGGANWSRPVQPYLHPTTVTIVPTPQKRTGHHLVQHNQNNSSANGLMRVPILAQSRPHSGGGGILMYPPGSVMGAYVGLHPVGGHQPPPPVACYNCGKRGHLGNTCPGVTMDDSDTSCE